jgi:hypothetical protein
VDGVVHADVVSRFAKIRIKMEVKSKNEVSL